MPTSILDAPHSPTIGNKLAGIEKGVAGGASQSKIQARPFGEAVQKVLPKTTTSCRTNAPNRLEATNVVWGAEAGIYIARDNREGNQTGRGVPGQLLPHLPKIIPGICHRDVSSRYFEIVLLLFVQ